MKTHPSYYYLQGAKDAKDGKERYIYQDAWCSVMAQDDYDDGYDAYKAIEKKLEDHRKQQELK